ncbi:MULTISPECIES: hypothetical protein [unclassified Streptomyces]|nr:hypothetical protein [Streptomyces sp. TSRI0107]
MRLTPRSSDGRPLYVGGREQPLMESDRRVPIRLYDEAGVA